MTSVKKLNAGQCIGSIPNGALVSVLLARRSFHFKINPGWLGGQFASFNQFDILKIPGAPQVKPKPLQQKAVIRIAFLEPPEAGQYVVIDDILIEGH